MIFEAFRNFDRMSAGLGKCVGIPLYRVATSLSGPAASDFIAGTVTTPRSASSRLWRPHYRSTRATTAPESKSGDPNGHGSSGSSGHGLAPIATSEWSGTSGCDADEPPNGVVYEAEPVLSWGKKIIHALGLAVVSVSQGFCPA